MFALNDRLVRFVAAKPQPVQSGWGECRDSAADVSCTLPPSRLLMVERPLDPPIIPKMPPILSLGKKTSVPPQFRVRRGRPRVGILPALVYAKRFLVSRLPALITGSRNVPVGRPEFLPARRLCRRARRNLRAFSLGCGGCHAPAPVSDRRRPARRHDGGDPGGARRPEARLPAGAPGARQQARASAGSHPGLPGRAGEPGARSPFG